MTTGGEDSGQPAWREHILGLVGLPSSMAEAVPRGSASKSCHVC